MIVGVCVCVFASVCVCVCACVTEREREREREREKEREREREREKFYSVLDRDVQTIFVLLPYLFQTFMTNSVPLASNKANFD